MLSLSIPGFGSVAAEYLVCDFTGTLSKDGRLLRGVGSRFRKLSTLLKIDVVTFDTFGTARKALRRLPCVVTVLTGGEGSRQKETFLESLGPDRCIAVGNGINDRGMLAKARLGIVVIGDEGAACKALAEADIVVPNIVAALDLLTTPRRILATLRN